MTMRNQNYYLNGDQQSGGQGNDEDGRSTSCNSARHRQKSTGNASSYRKDANAAYGRSETGCRPAGDRQLETTESRHPTASETQPRRREPPPFVTDEKETDEWRIAQRQKQVDFGKNTRGYQRYSQLVPRGQRLQGYPRTPDPTLKMSKRAFDGLVKSWRRKLHQWDPPQDEEELQPVLFGQEPTGGADTSASASDAQPAASYPRTEQLTPHDAQQQQQGLGGSGTKRRHGSRAGACQLVSEDARMLPDDAGARKLKRPRHGDADPSHVAAALSMTPGPSGDQPGLLQPGSCSEDRPALRDRDAATNHAAEASNSGWRQEWEEEEVDFGDVDDVEEDELDDIQI